MAETRPTLATPPNNEALEDIARRGHAALLRKRAEFDTPHNEGKVVVVDVDTGEVEVDADDVAAYRRARAKNPAARLYAARIGFPVPAGSTVHFVMGRM